MILENPEAGVLRGWPRLKATALYRRCFIGAICEANDRSTELQLPLRSDVRAGSLGALPLEALPLEALLLEELPQDGEGACQERAPPSRLYGSPCLAFSCHARVRWRRRWGLGRRRLGRQRLG